MDDRSFARETIDSKSTRRECMLRIPFVLAICVIMLQGCVTSKEIFLADGSLGHNINCSGSGKNFSNCLEKAGEICGSRGYHILDQAGNVVSFSGALRELSPNTRNPTVGYVSQSSSTITRNLLVKCKEMAQR